MAWTATFLENYLTSHLNGYNSHFWSLCVEMQFYVFIAIVVLIAGKRGLSIVFPVCVLITCLRIANGAYVDIATHLRADEILSGACVGLVYHESRQFPKSYRLIFGIALLWTVASSPMSGPLQYLRPYASALLIFASLSHEQTNLGAFLTSKPMRYVAAISYALYVIHHALIQGWWNEGTVLARYLLKRPLSFALTFSLAHLSTFYWERYWQNASKAWITRNRQNAGSAIEQIS